MAAAELLRLFPLNAVLFPGAELSLHVFEPRYKQMMNECLAAGEAFGVCLIRDGDEAGDPLVMPYEIGTTAEISDLTPLEGGRFYLNSVGRRRFKIERVISRDPYLLAEVEYLPDDAVPDRPTVDALIGEIKAVFHEYLRLLIEFSGREFDIELPDDPSEASFLIGDALQVADSMKQRLLELASTEQRLTVELGFLRRLLPQLRTLLEKNRREPSSRMNAPGGGTSRTDQERFFGKHFSNN
jgi:Lon protease-like protein